MDRSIRLKFRGDRHVLGPFLGNLPPEILDAVVQKLGWFRTTFAMAGRTCREAVGRVPCTRAELTDRERERLRSPEMTPLAVAQMTPLAVAVMEGDVEAMKWLMQKCDGMGLEWRDVSGDLAWLAAGRGKIDSLTYLHLSGCPWFESCLLYTSPSPRDGLLSRMPSSA